jgi:hypothetical protein
MISMPCERNGQFTVQVVLGVPVISVAPEKAAEHFGWFAMFAAIDAPSSSALTRKQLGWSPTQPDLIADLDQPGYFGA